MREAVYSGTRNLYPHMETAVKSLIAHSSVERVWLLIEDDEFPFDMPDIVRTVNVKDQEFFHEGGANWSTPFSYMSLIRVCYAKLFPESEQILQLDVDTIVADDVDYLFDIDMGNRWLAAVDEIFSSYKPYDKDRYYNVGVTVFNLKRIRKDKIDDVLIEFLNNYMVPYVDQDAWNKFAVKSDMVIDLPTRYNECFVTGYSDDPAIVHFAGFKHWWANPKVSRREYIRMAEEMSWAQAMTHHEAKLESRKNHVP